MPKLLSQKRPNARRKLPPCGRIINYVEPRSPFQKLIHHAQLAKQLSTRGLAKAIGKPQSTVWIWLHSENGYPHAKSYEPKHLELLASVLDLQLGDILATIDASKHSFTPQELPTPRPAADAFAAFIQILENDKRTVVKRSYVLNLARTIHAGTAAPSPMPRGSELDAARPLPKPKPDDSSLKGTRRRSPNIGAVR